MNTTYRVTVRVTDIDTYEIDASSVEEATENYLSGECIVSTHLESQVLEVTNTGSAGDNGMIDTELVSFLSAKAGIGNTTAAVLYALSAVRDDKKVIYIDASKSGDAHTVLGMDKPEGNEALEVPDTQGRMWLCRSTDAYSLSLILEAQEGEVDLIVIDGEEALCSKVVTVVTNNYQSIRAQSETKNQIDKLVVINTPRMPLTAKDCSVVLGAEISYTIPRTEEIARAVDAGTLPYRVSGLIDTSLFVERI